MKKYALTDLFTFEEIQLAARIYKEEQNGKLHQRLRDEVVLPAMPAIAQVTDQENDPEYLAYALEYLLNGVGAGEQ
jgi:hypothetical protein